MTTPRQARALDVLLAEVNAHAPHRDKGSDGGLGDARHAALKSDHNPNAAGVWTARDVTDDPDGGLDGSELAHKIAHRLGAHPALMAGAYVIHNARIISYNRLVEGWRPYAGLNAHRTHVHVSVSDAAAGYDSREPWDLFDAPARPVPPPAVPTAYTRFRNAWINHREVDWSLLDLLINRGQQPYAAAAKECRDTVQAAVKTFLGETR